MFTENKDTFSEVVDVTLYRYNSIDNRIWAILKNYDGHKKLSKDSVLVSSESLKTLLLAHFRKEIKVESIILKPGNHLFLTHLGGRIIFRINCQLQKKFSWAFCSYLD